MEKKIQQITKSDMMNAKVAIKGIHYKTKKPISLVIHDGKITSIVDDYENTEQNRIIAPGLVDIQINGYKGYDFNISGMDERAWKKVIEELISVGVTTFYPTLITNSYNHLQSLFKAYSEILVSNPVIEGFHLEGPYISPQDGPRGAHSRKHVRRPDWEEFCRLQEAASGMIKIITISPEHPEAILFTQKAVATGVKVAIGHTAATSEQIDGVVKAGASLSTHLGNGSHATLPRHDNYIWDQLANDRLFATVIADGHHLPNNLLNVFQRTKGRKMMIVSDSVMLAGLPAGDYKTEVGGEVTLMDNGFLHLKGNPKVFAGSAQHILHGVNYLVNQGICTLPEAIEKASVLPSTFMGLAEKRGIKVGASADIVVMESSDKGLNVLETYKRGTQIFKRTL